MKIDWLPDLVEFDGDWQAYCDHINSLFENDFKKQNRLTFNGQKITFKKHVEVDGKSATFWHIISSNNSNSGLEKDRVPDLDRCARILWPKSILENYKDPSVLHWISPNSKTYDRHILWLKSEKYVVIIEERKGYSLLWTAYIVKYKNVERRLQREYDTYKKASTAR